MRIFNDFGLRARKQLFISMGPGSGLNSIGILILETLGQATAFFEYGQGFAHKHSKSVYS